MSISQNFPSSRPSLNLNFSRSQKLDPRITFTRTTSGTRVGPDGYIEVIPADQPRFDFNPVTGECLGLLIEEQRTNLCFYGTTIQNFATRGTGTPIKTANATTAPDGTVTATRLQGDGTATPYFDDNSNKEYIAGRAYTFSCFFKANGTDEVYILLYGTNWNGSGGTNVVGHFDLTTGTSLGAAGGTEREPTGGARIEQYPNGWYRCSITETCATTHNANHQLIRAIGLSADIYAWGYQIEEGSFITSLIPTTTNTTATRTADNASITGSNFTDFYNPSEGTIFVDCTPVYDNSTNQYRRLLSIHNNSGSQTDVIQFIQGEQSNNVSCAVWDGSSFQTGFAKVVTSGTRYKVAFAVKENNMNASYDGNIGTDDTTCTLPAMTIMDVGKYRTSSDTQTTMHINNISYYPTRLSNTVLQSLTK